MTVLSRAILSRTVLLRAIISRTVLLRAILLRAVNIEVSIIENCISGRKLIEKEVKKKRPKK